MLGGEFAGNVPGDGPSRCLPSVFTGGDPELFAVC